jgi:hypothetical protein
LSRPAKAGAFAFVSVAAALLHDRTRYRGRPAERRLDWTPSLFFSHRWLNHEEYERFFTHLGAVDFFDFENLGVPRNDPLPARGERAIRASLRGRIEAADFFMVYARQATGHGDWTRYEVGVARRLRKPILAVRPHGYTGVIPRFITDAENQGGVVGFNARAIARRVRDYFLSDDLDAIES